jgi:hypothetical protein
MNLIQVQDRLKDMPTQAIMSYANGSNPDVPPYLALGELNRRKQMEQKQVQAPQGTVKDQIEQSVKLAQAQKAAQAQGQQKMTEAMGAQQSPVPGGTPQPQEQPEAGIAQLPTGPMNFRDGGIVSFADNPNQPASENMPSDEEERQRQARLRQVPEKATSPAGDILRSLGLADLAESFKSSQRDAGNKERSDQLSAAYDLRPGFFESLTPTERERRNKAAGILLKGPQAVPKLSQAELAAKAMAFKGKPEVDESQLGSPVNMLPPSVGGAGGGGGGGGAGRIGGTGGGRAPGGAPQAGGPAQDDDLAMLRKMRDELKAPTPVDRDAERAAFAKTNPYLNTLPGSRLEEMHAKIAQRDEEDRARFLKNEEERKQGRLNRGLMAGAEATRGQGGLGALGSFFMGFNKAGEAEDESAKTRMDAQRAMERQQEVLRAEVLDKIESARRAEARGDFATAIQDKKDAATATAKLAETRFTYQQAITTAAEAKRHNMTTEQFQREQLHYTRVAAEKGPQIEQNYNFIRKARPDLTPAQAYDQAVSLSPGGIAGEKLQSREMNEAEKEFAKDPLTSGLAQKVNMARFSENKAKIKLAEDEYEAHRKRFYKNKNLPLPEGSGGTAGDSTAGFIMKSVK